MEKKESLSIRKKLKEEFALSLQKANNVSASFGLALTERDLEILMFRQGESLRDSGRIDFGGGVLPQLIFAFCDSPYIDSRNYLETLCELQETFYYFKNESGERIPDDELIGFMRRHFDGECQGSLEYLRGSLLEDLCRGTRYGVDRNDTFDM